MNPETFEFEIAADGRAVAGSGFLAAFVPASHETPALLTMAVDPSIPSERPAAAWVAAAVPYLWPQLEVELDGEPLRLAAIDERGGFNQVMLRWPLDPGQGRPAIRLFRYPDGAGVDAFYRATGAAGEVAIELLTLLLEKPRTTQDTPTEREFLEAMEVQGNLPAPGGVFRKVDEAARGGDLRRIAVAIQPDPVISASILNAANAACFAGGGKTGSVPQAVNRLGTKAVLRLVFIAEMISRYKKGACPDFDYRRFWSYSIASGAAMRALIEQYRISGAMADDAFSTGLVSTLGWLAIAETFPDLMTSYVERCRNADPIAKARAQRELFPCPVRMVAERYLERFEFPEIIRATVAGRASVNRAWYDCLAQANRVAQALSPFECVAIPTTIAVPDRCREEWLRWQTAFSA